MRVMEVCGPGIESLKLIDSPVPEPQPGEVQIRMKATTLNYRDLLMLRGASGSGGKMPYVPLSCGCGEVTATGSGVTRFTVGDRVAPTFFQDWISGPRTIPGAGLALGGTVDGVARDFACYAQDYVVKVPDILSDLEAASLPCAALTAWSALFVARATKPGDFVLLQGTGGVSIAGLQLAKAAGAVVIITSSSDAKLERARALGADYTINYRGTPDWGAAARRITGGRGVDVVLDVVGMETLQQSQTALMPGGMIAAIGLLTGTPLWTMKEVPPEVKRIRVGNRDDFEAMNRAIAANGIRPVVDKVFPLEELGAAMNTLESGTVFGKVAIQLA